MSLSGDVLLKAKKNRNHYKPPIEKKNASLRFFFSGKFAVFFNLLLFLFLFASCGEDKKHPKTGSTTRAELMLIRDGVEHVSQEGKSVPVRGGMRLTQGQRVVSKGGRAFLSHDEGGRVLLSEKAQVEVGENGVAVLGGKVWVEAPEGIRTEYTVGELKLSSTGAGFELIKQGAETKIYTVRGTLYYELGDHKGEVAEGFAATVTSKEVTVKPKVLWDDWTGGLAWPSGPSGVEIPGLGEIGARRPGSLGKARFPLVIRRLKVRTKVRGDLAVTKVVQEFFNPVSEALEGVYKLRLPRGALLQSFGIDRDGEIVHGYIKEKQQATQQYRSQVYRGSKDDPALLQWEAPGLYKAQIYPIPPGSTRKVEVVYTEWLKRDGAKRFWRYPLSSGGGANVRIGELDVIADFTEAKTRNIQASLGAHIHKGVVSLNRSDYMPRADLVTTIHGKKPVSGRISAYRVPSGKAKEGDFFLTRIYPSTVSGKPSKKPEPMDLILIVDVSAGTDPTRLHLSRTMAEALMRHLTPNDRVTILGGDLELRTIDSEQYEEPKLLKATKENRESLLDALARAGVGGATDLGAMLTQAAALSEPGHRTGVVYLGDAAPTVGEMNLQNLKKRLERLESPIRLYGVAVGSEADLDLLLGLTGESGLALRIESRMEAGRTALEIISHLNRPVLQKVEVDPGPSVERVYPRRRVDIVEGEPLILVGRIRRKAPQKIRLKGLRRGKEFEETYEVKTEKLKDSGDVRLRWADNRLRQLFAEGAGREEMVELGTRFGLITPYTSFYVPSARELREDSEERKKAQRAGKEAKQKVADLEKSVKEMEKTADEAPPAEEAEETAKQEEAKAESEPARAKSFSKRVDPSSNPLNGLDGEGGFGKADSPAQPPGSIRRSGSASRSRRSRPSKAASPLEDSSDMTATGASVKGGEIAAERSPRRPPPRPRASVTRDRESFRKRDGIQGRVNPYLSQRGKDKRVIEKTLEQPPAAKDEAESSLVKLLGSESSGYSGSTGYYGRGISGAAQQHLRVDVNIKIDIKDHRPKRCSPASERPLSSRKNLWRERLRSRRGFTKVLEVWQDAGQSCELKTWSDRRTLLWLMLDRLGSVQSMLLLHRYFRRHTGIRNYLRRAIIGRVTKPSELKIVMAAMGLGRGAKWTVIQDLLAGLDTPELRLGAVRKLLLSHPKDPRLKTLLLDLLESMGRHKEAMVLIEEVKGDPYADADFRVASAEYLLRRDQKNKPQAKRILSEIVEFRPRDPAVRRRLGDLYRAYGWHEEAYRQYETLANLMPQDMSVLLLMASAAAGSGRIDEALRLEAGVAGTAEPGAAEGLAKWALLWTSVRLMKLRWKARQEKDTEKLARLLARTRRSGVLSGAKPLRVLLVWSHPSADVELSVGAGRYSPARAGLLGSLYGIEAFEVSKLDKDGYTVKVSRVGRKTQRVVKAQLLVMWNEGKPDEKLWSKDLEFGPKDEKATFKIQDGTVREVQ